MVITELQSTIHADDMIKSFYFQKTEGKIDPDIAPADNQCIHLCLPLLKNLHEISGIFLDVIFEDGTSCHDHIGSCIQNHFQIILFDATINFNICGQSSVIALYFSF